MYQIYQTVLFSQGNYALGHLYAFHNEPGDTNYWRGWQRWNHVGTNHEEKDGSGRAKPSVKSWWRTWSSRYQNTLYDTCFNNNDPEWPRLVCVNNQKRLVHYYYFSYYISYDYTAIQKGDIYNIAGKLPARAAFVDHVGFLYLFDFKGNVAQRKLKETKKPWNSLPATTFFGCR